jgi:hypothetical protein
MGVGTSVLSSQAFTTLATRVQASIDELKDYQSDTKAANISARYTTLLGEINKSIAEFKDLSTDIIAAQQSSYNTRAYNLELEKDKTLLRIKGISFGSVFQQIVYGIGMIFGMIIITNIMINEDWKYKLFYALWGAVFYPIVLLYGVFNPPQWHSLFIPFFEISTAAPSYIKYLTIFSYNPPGKAVAGGLIDKKLTLRIFTGIVIALCIVSQFIV